MKSLISILALILVLLSVHAPIRAPDEGYGEIGCAVNLIPADKSCNAL